MGIKDFFSSVEFYVIATVVAAAVIGLCVKPSSKGPAIQRLLAGRLRAGERKSPGVELTCCDDGTVELVRTGLDGVTDAGAVSLAVETRGFDITIMERTMTENCGEERNEAVFTLDFLAPEHYHIRYESEDTNLFCAFTLHVKPGIKTRKELGR